MNWKLVVAALALATAPPLAAQQPPRAGAPEGMGQMMGDPMGMQEMMAPVMRTMLYTPQHLLARKDALGLSGDQVARLTALQRAAKTARDAAGADVTTHVQAMAQAADAAVPDTTALKAQFEAAHAAMGKAHWATLAAAVEAKAVLNDAQRAKVKAWADSMQAWMQQHRRMMHAPESH